MNVFQAKFGKGKGRVVIDGREFSSGHVTIEASGSVIVDGVDQGSLVGPVNVELFGDVQTLETVSGDVDVSGSVGSISTQSGDVECGDVTGNVSTMSGDVTCGGIGGNVSTMSGDVFAGN